MRTWQEEELRRQKEEQEKRELEEYMKLKESFIVEETGETQQENEVFEHCSSGLLD